MEGGVAREGRRGDDDGEELGAAGWQGGLSAQLEAPLVDWAGREPSDTGRGEEARRL